MAIRAAAVSLLVLLVLGATAQAQEPVAEFYKGKQIRIIVASATGGGYDLYARYVARHLGKHLAGAPTVILKNMPCGGGLAAGNHLYTRAGKDGLTIGVLQGTLVYAQVGNSPNVAFDVRRFGWLGSANVTSNTCVFSKRAGIAGGQDLLRKSVIIGGTGGSTQFVPQLLHPPIVPKFPIPKSDNSTTATLPSTTP